MNTVTKAMDRGLLILIFIVFIFTSHNYTNEADNWPVLKGPYLGQKPPGMTPEIFAPGLISVKAVENLNSVFSLDGKEFFYAYIDRSKPKHRQYIMMHTKIVNGMWMRPRIFKHSNVYTDVDMAFSPDGKRLYFCSKRPSPITKNLQYEIWYCNKNSNGWSKPRYLHSEVNSKYDETYPTFARSGTMYFASARTGGYGSKDIYYSQLKKGKFQSPINLGPRINSEYGEGDIFIDPHENFIIVSSWGRPDDRGQGDLYISYKDEHNSWLPLKNMGHPFNTRYIEYSPMMSPDGKYFFFTRHNDIYWVDARILERHYYYNKSK